MFPDATVPQAGPAEPEQEDGDSSTAQQAAVPSLEASKSKEAATPLQQQPDADAMETDGQDSTALNSAGAKQSVPSQARAAASTKEAAAKAVQLSHAGSQMHGSAKPSYVCRGPRLLPRSAVPKSHAFTDVGSIKAALADAWSSESDIGKQTAALYELFGDSLLPYVPMLPCVSSVL